MALNIQLAAAVSLAVALVATPAFAASTPDYRLHMTTASPDAVAGIQLGGRGWGFDLLNAGDQRNLETARSRISIAELGPFDLAVLASKLRGGRSGDDMLPFGTDHYSMRSGAIAMGVDVSQHLTLQSELLFAHMRRHLATVEAGKPRMSTNMAAAGIAIVRDGGPRLSFDYLDISSGSHLSTFERIAADMGGAPLPGHGLRLALTSGADDPLPGKVHWMLSLASMHRPANYGGLSFGSGTIPDKRAELALRMSF